MSQAEGWKGNVADIRVDPEWETLDAKLGKALRMIIKGDFQREVANLEERAFRKHRGLVGGRMLYVMINQHFDRDTRLARPQILEEIQSLQIIPGKGALRTFMGQWDAAVERLVQAGETPQDQDFLDVAFRKQFVRSDELKDHVAILHVRLQSAHSQVDVQGS